MDFQTPPAVCDYMVALYPPTISFIRPLKVLEPTPGEGNLVAAIKRRWSNAHVTAPVDFWHTDQEQRFDLVVMNPPFSPFTEGWIFLQAAMQMSNYVISIMPWLFLTNSEKRLRILMGFGLREIIHLPRKIFSGIRMPVCIVHLDRSYAGRTPNFRLYEE